MNNETKTAMTPGEAARSCYEKIIRDLEQAGHVRAKVAIWKDVAQAAITAHEAAKPVGAVDGLVWKKIDEYLYDKALGFTYSIWEKGGVWHLRISSGIGTDIPSADPLATLESCQRAALCHHLGVIRASHSLLTDSRVEGLRDLLERAMCCLRHTDYRDTMATEIEETVAAFDVGEKEKNTL